MLDRNLFGGNAGYANPFAKSPLKLSSLVEPVSGIFDGSIFGSQKGAFQEAMAPLTNIIGKPLETFGKIFEPVTDQIQKSAQTNNVWQSSKIPSVQAPHTPQVKPSMQAPVAIPQPQDYLKQLASRYNNMYSFTPIDYDPFGEVKKQISGLYT